MASYWDRLDRYRTHGPEGEDAFVLMPARDFDLIVGALVDPELLPLGFTRGKGLFWRRAARPWAEQVVDFQPMRSGVGARWGLRLSFVPRIKAVRRGARDLDLSYDPLDYQREAAPWTLSRFATEDELRTDGRDLLLRVIPEAGSLDGWCLDLQALVARFEAKKARKAVRRAFHQYPKEVLAYGAALGLVGREAEGLREADAAFERLELEDADREKLRLALTKLWTDGV